MDFLLVLFVVVMLVEAIIEAITMLIQEFDVKMVYAGVLGMLFTWIFGLDILGFLEIELAVNWPPAALVFNIVVLGLLFIRHSGNLNNLLEWVKGLRPGE